MYVFIVQLISSGLHIRLYRYHSALHCGENRLRITKIIGGKNSQKHEFPWQASIRWRVGMTEGEHFCGGALIHIKFVLTAAHCFDLGVEPAYYNVTLGK